MDYGDTQLFKDVAREKYGRDIDLEAVEKSVSHLRIGGAITQEDLNKIADDNLWPFSDHWMWPSPDLINKKLCDTTNWLKDLDKNPYKKNDVISNLYGIFKNLELVSLILRFCWPENFGIYSPPPLYMLGTKRGKRPLDEYNNYLKDLELYQPIFKIPRVADVEMMLWAISYKKKKYISKFMERIAEDIPEKIPVEDLLRYLRSNPLKYAYAYLMKGDHVTYGKWAGEAAEDLTMNKCRKLGIIVEM